MTSIIIASILLALLMPPWLANLFRSDQAVPFMVQFVPQPLIRRLLVSSIVPVILVLVGMLPILLMLGVWLPEWSWGVVPVVWILSLVGHVEAVGRGSTTGQRNLFSVLVSSAAIFVVIWSATTNSASGIIALGPGIVTAIGVSLALLVYADYRHHGFNLNP
jgi:hypothetical protein